MAGTIYLVLRQKMQISANFSDHRSFGELRIALSGGNNWLFRR